VSEIWINEPKVLACSKVSSSALSGSALHAEGREVGGEFVQFQPLALLQAQHVELGRVVEQAAVVGAGLHQQREAGELGGAVVDVQAEEVLFRIRRGMARGW
jgi:hypothetical protein